MGSHLAAFSPRVQRGGSPGQTAFTALSRAHPGLYGQVWKNLGPCCPFCPGACLTKVGVASLLSRERWVPPPAGSVNRRGGMAQSCQSREAVPPLSWVGE